MEAITHGPVIQAFNHLLLITVTSFVPCFQHYPQRKGSEEDKKNAKSWKMLLAKPRQKWVKLWDVSLSLKAFRYNFPITGQDFLICDCSATKKGQHRPAQAFLSANEECLFYCLQMRQFLRHSHFPRIQALGNQVSLLKIELLCSCLLSLMNLSVGREE